MRREQVLDAAEVCFRAEGFHGASMARLAAAAKMSVGHIYQYFDSKDAIIVALCERRFSGFEELLVRVETDSRSATDIDEPPKGWPEFVAKYGTDFFAVAPPAYLGAIAAIAVATALLTLLFVRRAGRPAH